MNSLISTFLVGMLLASIALNVHQWRGDSLSSELESDNGAAAVVSEVPATMAANIDVDQLGLSKEQAEMLGNCGDGCCCQAMQLREEVRVATVALQEACAAPDVDESALMKLAENLCGLREREVNEHVSALLAVREVLNPEQMEELYRSACEDCPE